MSERAREVIRTAIEDHGPISFSEFMELALYGQGGFYEEPPIGEAGHFMTSPHVHPLFAQLLARGLREMWGALGRPRPFRLVELGAGDGTLARHLLRELAAGEGPHVEYTAVERSEAAREALLRLGLRVLPALEAAPTGVTGLLLANELLDNLPFHWVRGTPEGSIEIRVDRSGQGFVPIDRLWLPDDVDPEDAGGPMLANEERAVSIQALRLVERIPRVLRSGYALFIDYAGPVARGALVHGYRGHRVVEDVLSDPGSSDITAAVDLASIVGRAQAVGLQAFVPVSQRAALLALGYRAWEEAERRRQATLQDARSGRNAVQTWSGRNAAALLVDPQGLGRLRWLVLATPGLSSPPWVSEATRLEAEEQLVGDPPRSDPGATMRFQDVAGPGFVQRWVRLTGRRRRPRRRRSP